MKKKIFAILLCICMVAIAIAGGTMAYFTDTHAVENTFTAGKVGISLDEALVKSDTNPESDTYGDLIADGTQRTNKEQTYHLFPAMKVTKAPTIRVDSDSENAYIAAIVTVTGNIGTLIPMNGAANYIDINALASGGLLKTSTPATKWNLSGHETDECFIYQTAGSNTWTLYIFMKDVKAAGSSIVLFETLEIPADWDNDEMAKVNGMQIQVDAYATQEHSFKDCFTAMTTAFPSAFPFGSAS